MSRFGQMIDMATTPAEVMEKQSDCIPCEPSVSKYPYGLCISLDDETLEKLGLDGDLPASGDMIHLCAMAKVTNASCNERLTEDGKTEVSRRVELQITNMALESEDEENQMMRRSRFYGSSMGNKDAA